ncbi:MULTISPECIES: YgdI/YgdR family lipoprotein [Bacillus]|uniref:hypothetical protein n=1 Tax=Bacillus TaxID=1386 RepID=UPI000BB845CC|nr:MULTISPECIES: hypothetical protein [Bacillus]
MKKLTIVLIIFLFLSGCSSPTLQNTIEKSGMGKVNILFQDEKDGTVIYLKEEGNDQNLLVITTFFKTEYLDRYRLGSHSESKVINPLEKDDDISFFYSENIDAIILWGLASGYSDIDRADYTILDDYGNILHNSSVKLSKNNLIFDKLPNEIKPSSIKSILYKLTSTDGKVIVDRY